MSYARRMRTRTAPLVLILLCACATPHSERQKLGLAQRDVLDALQFGDYQVVAQYVRPEKRSDFLSRAYGVEQSLKVLELSTVSLDVFDERARSVARVSWYELPSTVVQTDTVFIDWVRAGEGWSIDAISGGPLQLEASP